MPKRALREQFIPFRPDTVNYDVPGHELDPNKFTYASNMRYDDEAIEKFSGFTDRNGTPIFPPVHIGAVQRPSDDAPLWVYMGTNGIGIADGVAQFDITPAGGIGAPDKQWTVDSLNSLPVFNPVNDQPVWWDLNTANPCQLLPDWEPTWRCSALRGYKNFLIAIGLEGTGQFGDMVRWSDSAVPGAVPLEWQPTPTNSAGFFALSSEPGDVIDGLTLRDQFILYKDHATYIMNFVGGQFIMSQRKFLATSGILSRNCVTEYQGFHYVMTDDDLIRHDGHTVSSIAQGRAKKFVFNTMSPQHFNQAFVAQNPGENEIWFCWPEGDSDTVTTALVYNTSTDSFGLRDLPLTNYVSAGFTGLSVASGGDWESDNEAWDLDITWWNEAAYSSLKDGLIGCSEVRVANFVYDDHDTENGVPVESYVERIGLSLGSTERIKLVKEVWPKLEGTLGDIVFIRVGSQMHSGHAVEWSPEIAFEIGVDDKADTFAQGRYISISFRSSTDNTWRLWGFDIGAQMMGFH